MKRLPWRASTIKASAAHVKWEKRRNENMPAWIEVLFFLNNSEIVGVLASQQMTLNHSVWWASLAMEELCCSSSALVPFFSPHFPSLLYIHGAFSTLFRPPLCITHTCTHRQKTSHTSSGWRGWGWCLASALTGLSSMLHCLTNSRWSTVAGHTCSQIGHFRAMYVCVCVCAHVWEDMCPPTQCETFCHWLATPSNQLFR